MSKLHNCFEYTTDAVFGIDKNKNIRFWNKGCENLIGLSSQQAIGRSCADLFCGEDLQGNKICGTECPIVEFFNAESPNSNFDLVLEPNAGSPIVVNVGSYYNFKTDKNEVKVYHSMRLVNSYQLIQRLSSNSFTTEQDNKKIHKLSKREYEVLRLLPSGSITKDIAVQLGISPATVRNHIKNIFTKLEVRSRAEAVTYAMHHGIT